MKGVFVIVLICLFFPAWLKAWRPDFRDHRANYGIGLAVKPFRWMTLHAVATANAVYGGIGVNFSNL